MARTTGGEGQMKCPTCSQEMKNLEVRVRIGNSDPLHVFKCTTCIRVIHSLTLKEYRDESIAPNGIPGTTDDSNAAGDIGSPRRATADYLSHNED